jgi:hypothetical protein
MNTCIVHITWHEITNKAAVKKFFTGLQDGRYFVTAKSLKRRSIPTNSFLHVIFTMLVEPLREAGWNNIRTMEDAKEFIKALFLTVTERNEKTGEEIKRVRHTSELNQEEANQLIDEIYQWSAEYLSYVIPEPRKQMQLFNEPILAHYDQEKQAIIIQ